MPTAVTPKLTEDQIDDINYLARVGETSELAAGLDAFAKSHSTSPSAILAVAVDPNSNNGALHMASANGHAETLKALLVHGPTNINLQNSAGNTPLHWAALNGHLEAVKILAQAGADVTVINNAGHDAVYEAEVNEKLEVAEWLLKEGKGLESGIGDGSEEQAADIDGAEALVEGGLEDVVMREGTMEEGN